MHRNVKGVISEGGVLNNTYSAGPSAVPGSFRAEENKNQVPLQSNGFLAFTQSTDINKAKAVPRRKRTNTDERT